MIAKRSLEQARKEDKKLLTSFLRFLDRKDVELSGPRHGNDGEFYMVNISLGERRDLIQEYLTKRR